MARSEEYCVLRIERDSQTERGPRAGHAESPEKTTTTQIYAPLQKSKPPLTLYQRLNLALGHRQSVVVASGDSETLDDAIYLVRAAAVVGLEETASDEAAPIIDAIVDTDVVS